MMAAEGGLLSGELPNQLLTYIKHYVAFVKSEKCVMYLKRKSDTAHPSMKGLFRKKTTSFHTKKRKCPVGCGFIH